MKTTLFQLFSAVVLMVPVCSCNDLLDTTSKTSLSSASVFDTPDRIEALVNGAYKSLKSADLYSGRLLHCNDLRGEEFICLTENSLGGGYAWQQNLSSTTGEVNSIWSQAYRLINNANILIAGLSRSEGILSDEAKKNYAGEAHFLRALAYFTLVTTYARPYTDGDGNNRGVPLRLLPESTSENNDLERSDVKIIYEQIINDLDAAELYLPEQYATALQNTVRAHKNTAIALKTRVYLSKHDFAGVREEARKIVAQEQAPFSSVSGVQHQLQSNITEIFSSDYTTGESIFSMPMSAADPPSGSALATVYHSAPNYALNHTAPGILTASEWTDTDARRSFVREQAGLYYLTKFSKVSPAIDYIPVIRYAEVLLNYAEAEIRGGGAVSKAIALLEAVRHRSDPGYHFPESQLTADRLLHTIRIERRIELLGEGFRSTDILRDLLTFPDKPSRSSYTSREVKPDDEGYVFPLPNSEILTNKLLLN
ncbi:MAG: RagB/SusD family nutrient uptake outer membrane protein [Tannerella sp.]|jgi:hypothetical protein|nr:RagB/SusD family nutrient uptake outer membrane protein [Tannerella sp.]